MRIRPDAVQHDPCETDAWIVIAKAAHDGRNGSAHGRCVDDEHHWRVEQARHVSGGRGRAVEGAVEETHDAFDDQQVRAGRRSRRERHDRLGPAQPGVDVARRTSAREGVVAGIDEVGSDLRRRHP